MSRNILDEAHIHPAIRDRIANLNRDIVEQVQQALAEHKVLVGGAAALNSLIGSGELGRMMQS